MSYADYCFINTCRDIIDNGFSDEEFDVRARWDDGTPAHTKKLLHVVHNYDLQWNQIPVMTMRKTAFKTCIDEILWIYQKKSNRIDELNSHIWDQWDIGNGTIGKAYGYQIGLKHAHHKYDSTVDNERLLEYPSAEVRVLEIDGKKGEYVYLDQIDAVLWDLKYNPGSRSIMTNMYAHSDLYAMGLRPCAYSMTFNVTTDSHGNKVLNSMLNQRSQDMLTANNWNCVQYAVLTHMLAQVSGMKVGQFTHVICDAHIYDRHIPIVEDMIERYDTFIAKHEGSYYDVPHSNPVFWINPKITDFYSFTVSDFKLVGYQYESFNYKIPVAV